MSPYTRAKKNSGGFRVDHGVYGHESILKLISHRFGLGFLTRRHRYARNIGRSFDWANPDFTPVGLPDPPQIVTTPCALGGRDVLDSQQSHANDLAELEEAAERFGVPVYEGKAFNIFTQPDTVVRAVRRQRAKEARQAALQGARTAR